MQALHAWCRGCTGLRGGHWGSVTSGLGTALLRGCSVLTRVPQTLDPPPVSAPVSSLGWWPAPTPGRSVPRGFAAVGEVSAFLTLSHSFSSSWRGPRELRRGATCPAADHGQDRTAGWDGDGSWAYPSSHSPTGCGQRAAAACRRTWGHEDWGSGGPVGAGWRRAMPLTRPLLPAAWSTTFGSRRAASSGC